MTKEQEKLVIETMNKYIETVNSLVLDAVNGAHITRYTTADVIAELPSALKNQCIRDAQSIYRKYSKKNFIVSLKNKTLSEKGSSLIIKTPKVPTLKKPCFFVNNKNFKFKDDQLSFPVFMDGRSKRIFIRTSISERQKGIFSNTRLGTMRVVSKGNKIVAQIVYDATICECPDDGNVMGVDLGIKCPAVSYASDGSVKFYGNGRKNKYLRRHYRYLRKKLQKEKHINALNRINDKEQRIMKDADHKLSHDIVETAVAHDVKVIKLERLSNIRSATRTSRKNNHNLHNWSFYRLARFIEYKAKLAGIKVEYVNPAYTSQRCPVCGRFNHATDRNYYCKCGYRIHRDLLGAINICNSTEYVGDGNIRHTA